MSSGRTDLASQRSCARHSNLPPPPPSISASRILGLGLPSPPAPPDTQRTRGGDSTEDVLSRAAGPRGADHALQPHAGGQRQGSPRVRGGDEEQRGSVPEDKLHVPPVAVRVLVESEPLLVGQQNDDGKPGDRVRPELVTSAQRYRDDRHGCAGALRCVSAY